MLQGDLTRRNGLDQDLSGNRVTHLKQMHFLVFDYDRHALFFLRAVPDGHESYITIQIELRRYPQSFNILRGRTLFFWLLLHRRRWIGWRWNVPRRRRLSRATRTTGRRRLRDGDWFDR